MPSFMTRPLNKLVGHTTRIYVSYGSSMDKAYTLYMYICMCVNVWGNLRYRLLHYILYMSSSICIKLFIWAPVLSITLFIWTPPLCIIFFIWASALCIIFLICMSPCTLPYILHMSSCTVHNNLIWAFELCTTFFIWAPALWIILQELRHRA